LLRKRGWDAVHVREIAMRDATDREILAGAAADGRACVTLDKDFHEALGRSRATYPSVILLRWQKLRADGVAEVIDATLNRPLSPWRSKFRLQPDRCSAPAASTLVITSRFCLRSWLRCAETPSGMKIATEIRRGTVL
jgi:predicted nuclease of predicted toxin-antitoxin system